MGAEEPSGEGGSASRWSFSPIVRKRMNVGARTAVHTGTS